MGTSTSGTVRLVMEDSTIMHRIVSIPSTLEVTFEPIPTKPRPSAVMVGVEVRPATSSAVPSMVTTVSSASGLKEDPVNLVNFGVVTVSDSRTTEDRISSVDPISGKKGLSGTVVDSQKRKEPSGPVVRSIG